MSSLASLCDAESSARRQMEDAYIAVLRTLHDRARGDCTSLECSVVAGVPHEAETPYELSFRAGDRLTVVGANPRADGRLFGRHDAREDYRFFPSAAVAPIPLPPGLSWSSVAGSEDTLCVVCTEPMINGCILRPCRHAMCGACAARVSKCPHCRARIDSHAPDHATACAAIEAARYQCNACEVIFRTAADACGHFCPRPLWDNERDGRGALKTEERRQWEELQTALEAPFRALKAARLAFVEAETTARRALGGDFLEQLRRVLETCSQFIVGLRHAQEAIGADERECRQRTKGNESWLRDNIVQGFLFGREKFLAEEQERERKREAQAALERQREQSAAAWKKVFVLDENEVVERGDCYAEAHGLSPSAVSERSADTTDPVVERGGSQSRFLDPRSQPPFNPFSDEFARTYGYRQVLAFGHEHLQCGGCGRPMTDATRLTCGHDMCQCCASHRDECAWCRAPIRGIEPSTDLAEAACLAPIAYVCDACGLVFDLVDDVLFHGCVSPPFVDTVV